jgi:hypothetical protein
MDPACADIHHRSIKSVATIASSVIVEIHCDSTKKDSIGHYKALPTESYLFENMREFFLLSFIWSHVIL